MKPDNVTVFQLSNAVSQRSGYPDTNYSHRAAWSCGRPTLYTGVNTSHHYCYCKGTEWMDVGAWVYENFDVASGVSFLPHSDHTYQQAPYQDIEPDEYLEWKQRWKWYTLTGTN